MQQYEFFGSVLKFDGRNSVFSSTVEPTENPEAASGRDCPVLPASGECYNLPTVQEPSSTVPRSANPLSRRRDDVYLQMHSMPTHIFIEVVKPTVLAQEALLAATLSESSLRAFQHTSLNQQKLVFELKGNRLILVFEPSTYANVGFLRVALVDTNAERSQSFDYFTRTGWFTSEVYPGLIRTVQQWASRLNALCYGSSGVL